MISRLALVALALSVTVPVCSSSILQAPLGARLDSGDSSLFTRAWSAVSSGLPRITNTRVLLADAAPALQQPGPSQEGSQHMRASGTKVLRVHPIKGDGRCLFRAIARSLAHVEGRPLTESYETKDADALRKAAMYVICNEKREAFEQAKVIEGDMKTYCRNMNSPNFFGGEPELFVLAEELRRPIAVYVPQGSGFKAIVEYGAKYGSERPRVRILYNGQNHYDALLD